MGDGFSPSAAAGGGGGCYTTRWDSLFSSLVSTTFSRPETRIFLLGLSGRAVLVGELSRPFCRFFMTVEDGSLDFFRGPRGCGSHTMLEGQ